MEEFNSPLSPTALIYKLVGELMELAEKLDETQQRIVKKFFDVLLNHRTAISDSTTLLPLEAALYVIQIEEHRNTNYEISELHTRMDEQMHLIQELTSTIEELRKRLNDKT